MPWFHCLALCIFGICCSSLSHALFPLFGSLHFRNLLLFPFSCLVSIVWLFAFLEFAALPFLMPCFHCLALCIFGICCSSLSHALFPLFGSLRFLEFVALPFLMPCFHCLALCIFGICCFSLSHALFPLFGSLHFWNLLLFPFSCLVSIVWLVAFLEFAAHPFLMPCSHCLASCIFGICCSSLSHALFPLFGSLHFWNLLLFPFSCLVSIVWLFAFLEFAALPFLMPCFHCLAFCIFIFFCSSLSHALFPLLGLCIFGICCSSLSHALVPLLGLCIFGICCSSLSHALFPLLGLCIFGICGSSLSHALFHCWVFAFLECVALPFLTPCFHCWVFAFLEFVALPFLMPCLHCWVFAFFEFVALPFLMPCFHCLGLCIFGICCSSLSHALFPLFGFLHLFFLLFPFSCLVSIVGSLHVWNLLLFPFSCLVSIVGSLHFWNLWLFPFSCLVPLLGLCILGMCCSSLSHTLFPLLGLCIFGICCSSLSHALFPLLGLCNFGICCSSLSHALFPLFGSLHFWNLLLFPFSCLVSIVWLFAFLEFVALPFLIAFFHCLALCIFGICCSSLSHALFPLFGSLHFWNLLLFPFSCLVSIVWLFAFLEFVALPFLMPCFHCLALCIFGICCSSLSHALFPLFGSLHFWNLLLFPFSCLVSIVWLFAFLEFVALPFLMPCFHCLALCIFLEFVALPFLMPCFHCLALCFFGICCSSLSHALFPLFGSLHFWNLLLFPFSCLVSIVWLFAFLEFVALPFLMPCFHCLALCIFGICCSSLLMPCFHCLALCIFGICCSSLSHALFPVFGSLHFWNLLLFPFSCFFFHCLALCMFGICCSSLSHELFPLFGSLHFRNLLLFPFSCLFLECLALPFLMPCFHCWVFAILEFVALPFLMHCFHCLALCIFGICCSSLSHALFPLFGSLLFWNLLLFPFS